MSSDDSDIELIGASSQQPEPLTRPPLTATRSQTINLVATSDLEPEEETLPVLPVLSQNHTTNPGKGKKRAMDPFDEPVHVPQPETRPERPAAAMPVKRKSTGESSKSSVETGKTKKVSPSILSRLFTLIHHVMCRLELAQTASQLPSVKKRRHPIWRLRSRSAKTTER